LNIDHVYQVEHIARPGETLPTLSYSVFAGGKGANQSAALGRAGAVVHHAGCVGADGRWLLDKLQGLGVDVTRVSVGDEPTGHAVIQVDARGENAIFLYSGANHTLAETQIDTFLGDFSEGDILLLQNEINLIPEVLTRARDRGMRIVLNPAPYAAPVAGYPLDLVDVLVVNRAEAAGLAGLGSSSPAERWDAEELLSALAQRWPRSELVLTLGATGARYWADGSTLSVDAVQVHAVDTTGAGDTFIGYFVAGFAAGLAVEAALARAAAAAALACTRPGAMDSIPTSGQVDAAMAGNPL
jgi:ribokinase